MNESDLENELRALRPLAPSPGLNARIAAALNPQEITLRAPRTTPVALTATLVPRPGSAHPFTAWIRSLGWAAAGAAATVIALLAFQKPASPIATPTPEIAASIPAASEYEPAESESELVDADDSGIIYGEGSEPLRRMRLRTVERYAWADPATGARVEVEVPREDIVLMPVAMQ